MSHPSDLSVRVAALERQNRHLRRFVGAAVLCAVAVPLLAAFGPVRSASGAEELKAQRFVLVDTSGAERGALEFVDGTSRLVLRGTPETERIILAADPGTGYLLLRDDQEKNRLGLAVDMFPHLMLQDGEQRPRIHASVGVTGSPSVLFSDDKGNFALGMGIDEKGKVWRKPEIDRELEAAAAKDGEKRVAPPEEQGEGKKKDG